MAVNNVIAGGKNMGEFPIRPDIIWGGFLASMASFSFWIFKRDLAVLTRFSLAVSENWNIH
jgi:hypothetical protein